MPYLSRNLEDASPSPTTRLIGQADGAAQNEIDGLADLLSSGQTPAENTSLASSTASTHETNQSLENPSSSSTTTLQRTKQTGCLVSKGTAKKKNRRTQSAARSKKLEHGVFHRDSTTMGLLRRHRIAASRASTTMKESQMRRTSAIKKDSPNPRAAVVKIQSAWRCYTARGCAEELAEFAKAEVEEIAKVEETGATHTRWRHHKSRPAHPAEVKEQRTHIRWVMDEAKIPSSNTRWTARAYGRIRVSPEFKPIRSLHNHRLRGRVRLSLLDELRESARKKPSAPKQFPACDRVEDHLPCDHYYFVFVFH